MGHESHRRSLVKAVSWRVAGTIDTFLISWLVTGEPVIAATISLIEIFTKIGLFYLHERGWSKIRWGRLSTPTGAMDAPIIAPDSQKR